MFSGKIGIVMLVKLKWHKIMSKSTSNIDSCCQFHQYFTSNFFLNESVVCWFLLSQFFVKMKLAKKLLVKCWLTLEFMSVVLSVIYKYSCFVHLDGMEM